MSKLKTLALVAGITVLPGSAAAQSHASQSNDNQNNSVENREQETTVSMHNILDRTLGSKQVRNDVRNVKYLNKSLSNDGTVFVGKREDGKIETRSSFATEEQGLMGVQKIGNRTVISNKVGDFTYDTMTGKVDFTSKDGSKAKFSIIKGKVEYYFSEEVQLRGDIAGLILNAEKLHEDKVKETIKSNQMVKIENNATLDLTTAFQKSATRY